MLNNFDFTPPKIAHIAPIAAFATIKTLRKNSYEIFSYFYTKQTQFSPVSAQKQRCHPKTNPIQTQFKANFKKAKK
jgi:hypothetical protein